MKIKKLSIKNFKGISNVDFHDLKQVIQFVGSNASGKTSIHDALQFLFSPGKTSASLVRQGERKAEVKMECEVKGQKIEILKHLTSEGKQALDIRINGEIYKDSKSVILKNLLGIASFQPDKIISPKERFNVFSSLIEEKFSYPTEIEFFEADDFLPSKETLASENPIKALSSIENGLKNYRLIIGREKKSSKSLYEETRLNYAKKMEKIEKEKTTLNKKEIDPWEKLIEKKASYDSEAQNYLKNKTELENNKGELKLLTLQIEDLNKKLQDLTIQKRVVESDIKKTESNLKPPGEYPGSLILEIKISEMINESKKLKDNLDEYERDFNLKESKYSEINSFLQNDFCNLYGKYIKSIQKQIPEIDFQEGNWLYKGKNIETLSRSETMTLALQLVEAQGRDSNIVAVDNAEMFDDETAGILSIKTPGTTFCLFKVGEPFNLESSIIKLGDKKKK